MINVGKIYKDVEVWMTIYTDQFATAPEIEGLVRWEDIVEILTTHQTFDGDKSHQPHFTGHQLHTPHRAYDGIESIHMLV